MQKNKANIINLGCRLNIYEGEVIKHLTSKSELSDYTIINSSNGEGNIVIKFDGY